MNFLIYIALLILSYVIIQVFIYLRIRTNPGYKNIPFLMAESNGIFGIFGDFQKADCRLIEIMKNHGAYFPRMIYLTFMCWGKARLNVGNPKWIKYVLNNKNFIRGEFPGAEDIFIGVGDNGLIVVNGDSHKRLRKLASPAFKLTTLKKLMPVIEMCGQRMVNLFRMKCQEADGNDQRSCSEQGQRSCSEHDQRSDVDRGQRSVAEVEIKDVMTKTTLDVIGLITFDHDFEEALSFNTDTFGNDMRQMLDLQLSMFCILPYQLPLKKAIMKLMALMPDWFFEITKSNRLIRRCRTAIKIHHIVDKMINDKISDRKNGRWSESHSKSLLDFILDAGNLDATLQEIHDLLMTFLIAGHETSSLGVTWSLYLLAKHPDYQKKGREEAKQFFQRYKDSPIDWDSLKQLTWLQAIVHESLRLYPPVPWVHRVSTQDDVIDGYDLPTNSDVLLITAAAQRNGEFWPNPHDFLPERFFDFDSVPWDMFMPFGDGPNKCIGYQLAVTEMVYFLALILNEFEFTTDPNVEYYEYAIITMTPKPALKLFIKPC